MGTALSSSLSLSATTAWCRLSASFSNVTVFPPAGRPPCASGDRALFSLSLCHRPCAVCARDPLLPSLSNVTVFPPAGRPPCVTLVTPTLTLVKWGPTLAPALYLPQGSYTLPNPCPHPTSAPVMPTPHLSPNPNLCGRLHSPYPSPLSNPSGRTL